ncbi:hypothetical protein ACOSQ4_031574 [Xanthoceras sorbifolium]
MPRSRGSEIPQRQSPRGSHKLKTSSFDSDPVHHHRPIADRSPKLGDRRSPRAASQPDPLNQKKLGTRIADLESQLGQAQEELKILKEQLAFAEAAKKEAQEELDKKRKKSGVQDPVKVPKQNSSTEIQECKMIKSSRRLLFSKLNLSLNSANKPMKRKKRPNQLTYQLNHWQFQSQRNYPLMNYLWPIMR